jgi:hypothetical protein
MLASEFELSVTEFSCLLCVGSTYVENGFDFCVLTYTRRKPATGPLVAYMGTRSEGICPETVEMFSEMSIAACR